MSHYFYDLTHFIFSFIFLVQMKAPKSHSENIWPLSTVRVNYVRDLWNLLTFKLRRKTKICSNAKFIAKMNQLFLFYDRLIPCALAIFEIWQLLRNVLPLIEFSINFSFSRILWSPLYKWTGPGKMETSLILVLLHFFRIFQNWDNPRVIQEIVQLLVHSWDLFLERFLGPFLIIFTFSFTNWPKLVLFSLHKLILTSLNLSKLA